MVLLAFTVVKSIREHDCTCSCMCAPSNEPSYGQIPPAPNSNFENQFKLVKIIRNRICECACSCTSLKATKINETDMDLILSTTTDPPTTVSTITDPPTTVSTTSRSRQKVTTISTIQPTQPTTISAIQSTIVSSTQSWEKNLTSPKKEEEEDENLNRLGAFIVAVDETTPLLSTESTTTPRGTTEQTLPLVQTTALNIPTATKSSRILNLADSSATRVNQELESEKQRQLKQARNWQRFLLERANIRQRAMANANTLGKPFSCTSIREFSNSFKINDPASWIEENCEPLLKSSFPNASCDQIVRIFMSCFNDNKE